MVDREANKWIALICLDLEVSEQPQVKETTNALLKELQSALKSNALFMDQIQLSLKGIVRVLEALKFGFLKTPTR
ncbi:hypothetical protein [Helicobacter pylori]|uniref:hypothetical protein n=1 Tax=Helicobacter pylori TaxID=210 RepID=UPI001FD17D57|nr:hypothetical protein [Helicobacter pylori]UOS61779.1 hypothetical protein MPG00_05030 [Helicobacter pylori]